MADYQNWYRFDTYPTWDVPLQAGGVADNITGWDITQFKLNFRSLNGTNTLGTGTFSVKANYPAEVYYQPSDNDVANAFTGTLIISTLAPNSKKAVWDSIPFAITETGTGV